MNSQDIQQLHQQYVMPTYAPGLALVRGEGATVWDADGNAYLDFIAGIAVTALGHCHPALVEAIRDQAGRLMHVSNLFYNELQPQLARAISQRSLGGKVFFCNSGAEANEGLIKLARLWGHSRGRYRIVTLRNSFHGRTLATLTATGQDKVQQGFEPLPDGFDYAVLNDLDSVRRQVGPRTAAVLVEAVQGEGGICAADPAFLQGIRDLCDEQGILMLCDEVQCGFGRTGEWFGWQAIGVQPDAMSMAKGMGGGFPIGGMAATPALSDVFQPGHHATTFGGTPLACAAALAVIHTIESEDLLARATARGQRLRDGLAPLVDRYHWIEGVRGIGLIDGLVLNRPAADLMNRAREKGLLVLATAHTVIRFVPPLTISEDDVDRALSIISEACAECDAHQGVTTS
jgi:predicted acetylornithine/succinylornithine family transaminase